MKEEREREKEKKKREKAAMGWTLTSLKYMESAGLD